MKLCPLSYQINGYFCSLKTKNIKKTSKILGFIVAALFLFSATIYTLLGNSSVQQFIVQTVIQQLSEKLDAKVSVGKIHYRLFNSISIQDLYVEDQHKDTLLFVPKTYAHFDMWRILSGKILVTSLELNQLSAHLKVDSTGHSNIEFLIKAFSKPESKDTSAVEYQVKSFRLIDSHFSYFNAKHFKAVKQGFFNGNDLKFSNINADIVLNYLKKDSINLEVNNLQATEHAGLKISKLSFAATGMKHGIHIPEFTLLMPESDIHIHDLSLKYKSTKDFKDFVHKVRWNVGLNHSTITLSDLATFVPVFSKAHAPISLKGNFSGRISNLRAQDLELKYNKSLMLSADVDINGLPDLENAFTYLDLRKLTLNPGGLQDLLAKISGKPVVIPAEITSLGTVSYKGNITGFLSSLVAYGNLHTDLGSVSTDLSLKIANHLKDLNFDGTIKTKGFQLGTLLRNKDLGNVSFSIHTKGEKKADSDFKGEIHGLFPDFTLKNYSYHQINVNGKFDNHGFNGDAQISDPNIQAQFEGMVDLTHKEMPVYKFGLDVDNANLQALNLINNYQGAVFSLRAKSNLTGPSLDNLNGTFSLDSIMLSYQDKKLNMDKIFVVSSNIDNRNQIIIESDYLNGTINGSFKLNTMGNTVRAILQDYLPSFAGHEVANNYRPNYLRVNLTLDNLNELSEIFNLPYKIEGTSTINGYIDERAQKVDIQCNVPTVQSEKNHLENLFFHLENPQNKLMLSTRALMQEKTGPMNMFATFAAYNDSIHSLIGWQNTQAKTNAGEINTILSFDKERVGRISALNFEPSQIIIGDSVWNIHPCKIEMKADSSIHVNNFAFDCHDQYIHINGIASRKEEDQLKVDLNDVNLDFIFSLIKLKSIWIGGSTTGNIAVSGLLKQPHFNADLKIKELTLNHKSIGDANIEANWDQVNHLIQGKGVFTQNGKIVALSNMAYVPKNDSLELQFHTNGISMAFLNRYFESVVTDFNANASGYVRVFGPTHKIRLEANALVKEGQALLNITNTPYYFSDSVKLTPTTIQFKKLKLYDSEHNSGTVTGIIQHDGGFGKMKYNVGITTKKIMALNTTAAHNPFFFGKAYANGSVHITGDDYNCNIGVDVSSQAYSRCFINMASASTATDNSFIHFSNKRNQPIRKEVSTPEPIASTNRFNVKVDLQIAVTPEAEMELLIDPKGGDIMTGRGEGNLRVTFDSFSDLSLFGTYSIQNNGYYLFTLQNLLRREFKIDRGSTLTWTGDPFHANVNVKAIYPVTASLKDLDPSFSENSRSNVPVNCVLKITDDLMKPSIAFDIDLPQTDENIKQQVKSLISTEEMMNKQVFNLMVFNKFLSNDYIQNSTSPIGSNEALSLGLSTLSGQVNSWLSKAVDNLTIGVDYKMSDPLTNESQFSTQLYYQPNNRVIINGNFGYTTDNANVSNNTNRFIGDVDMEYLLTSSGKMRLKAYNHSINRTITTARTTQGVGLLYKEDFQSTKNMFHYYLKWLIGKGKKSNESSNKKK